MLSCFASATEASRSSAVPNAAVKPRDFMKKMETSNRSALPAVVIMTLICVHGGFLIGGDTTICDET